MIFMLCRILEGAARVFLEAAPYVLLGLLAAGLLHAYCPPGMIFRALGPNTALSVVKAALLGIPLPLCSCAVIPTALALRKQGASKGATISFLIATPETGVDSIAISIALLDPLLAIFRPLAALVTSVGAGIVQNLLGYEENPSPAATDCACDQCLPGHSESSKARISRLRTVIQYGFGDLLNDLAIWLVLGMLLAGIIDALVPSNFFERDGASLTSKVLMLAASIPLYICASASTPLAAALIAKGLSPGAALVLLLAGPATNAATIMAVARFLGLRTALLYVSSIAVFSILIGTVLDGIYAFGNLEAASMVGTASELIPFRVRVICALFLAAILGRALFRSVLQSRAR